MRPTRVSGVLAHPTSFPGPHGIGDLGTEAYRFLDWLAMASQRLWQVMPLGPTGYGDSPYAALSAFAGNPLLISLHRLQEDGLLDDNDMAAYPTLDGWQVEYGTIIGHKAALLRRAFDRFRRGAAGPQRSEFQSFCDRERGWLDDYALFMAVKDANDGRPWPEWPADVRSRDPEAIATWTSRLEHEIRYYKFSQFQFSRQWSDVRRYANEKGVKIVGDIPIFVAHDSVDVWANQSLFRLDEGRLADGRRGCAAGSIRGNRPASGAIRSSIGRRWPLTAMPGGSPGCGRC